MDFLASFFHLIVLLKRQFVVFLIAKKFNAGVKNVFLLLRLAKTIKVQYTGYHTLKPGFNFVRTPLPAFLKDHFLHTEIHNSLDKRSFYAVTGERVLKKWGLC